MVTEYTDFCEDNLCDKFILIAKSKFKPAGTLGNSIEGYRVAESCWIYDNEDDDFISYKMKLSELINIPMENMENINIVKYEIGGEYKNHQDFFHPGESYYDEVMKRGGQRSHTALLYLNDDFLGGETNFPNLKIKIKPEKSKVIIWTNINEDGTLDYDSIHAGLPVTSGTKYIATIWIRQSKFA